MPRRLTRHTVLTAAILLLAVAGLYVGWRVFWFLTDDAYIAFRYISNAHLGFGYVWNAPPFKPVEGYTSFLWVVLLDLLWRVTGLEPPATANAVALIFALGTLLLTAALVLRLRLGPALERYRLLLLALVLAGTLSNRTFLAWTSSGLETAMFNFWLTAWVFIALSLPSDRRSWFALLTGAAALMALTRPDGLLFVGATLALFAVDAWGRRGARAWRWGRLAALAPLLLVAAHLLWRRATYGAWLPNTYLAKQTGPWPESGARYLLSFIIEYSLWFWIALAVVFVVALARRQGGALPARVRRLQSAPLDTGLVQLAVIGALAAHFAYYTVIIGGDHFEYRVYSQLVPLLWVSFVWLLNALLVRPGWALALITLSLAAGLPIPWTHWAISQQYTTRLETWAMRLPVAPYFPAPVRPYVQVFDTLQDWLILHAVGVRHQEHKLFSAYQASTLPPREVGLLLRPEAEGIRAEGAVGVIGWVLPTVAILDAHGLNDAVIARTPIDPTAERLMAHDRVPPPGYIDCFQTDLAAPISKIIVMQRSTDLNTTVPLCENIDWAHKDSLPPPAGYGLTAAAGRVLDNIWMPDPIFAYYVPADQTPVQTVAALSQAFDADYHDTGCLVYPPPNTPDGYAFAFLPANVRYAPEELRATFPWASLVDFARTGGPRPYTSVYALPAGAEPPPGPAVAHPVEWAPASLLGYRLSAGSLTPGGEVEIELYFQTKGDFPTEQWFQLSLVNPAQPEVVLGSDQADPCRGLYPAWLWQPGQTIVAKSIVYLPGDLPAGDYGLRVSMFDLTAGPGEMLPATGDDVLLSLPIR